MKKLVTHLGGFLAVFLVMLILLENIFFDGREIKYSWHTIQEDREVVDVVVLGNSHAYTSTDAAILSDVWGVNVEVFASANSNMEENLIHLKETLKYQSPKYVMLEVYGVCADSRDTLKEEKRGVLFQDLDGIRNVWDKFHAVLSTTDWNHIPEGMFQLFRPTNTWSRWSIKNNKRVVPNTTHGYITWVTKTYATSNKRVEDVENDSIQYEGLRSLTDYNMDAFTEFLQLTKEHGIKVILYKAPTMGAVDIGLVRSAFKYASGYDNVIYHADFHQYMTEMGLEGEDFYDAGHLNRRGGEKFTYYLANSLSDVVEYDCDWENAWGYRQETVEEIQGGGIYRYQMENYSKDTLFKFLLYENGKLVGYQEYSEDNTFICNVDVRTRDEYELYCYMIPKGCLPEGDYCPDCIKLSFMKMNQCVIQ